MWVYNNTKGCIYKYPYCSGEQVKSELDAYQGYVQSDAYAGYNILFGEDNNRINVGYWAHARRKYMDVINWSYALLNFLFLNRFYNLLICSDPQFSVNRIWKGYIF